VANPQGLHARPADLFAKLARRFGSTIEVVKDGKRVDGKSILDVLTLAADKGTMLTIVARGDDADEAVEALVRLVELENPAEEFADETKHS
jgi:phosphotransferase system HPr (HPr) family protein